MRAQANVISAHIICNMSVFANINSWSLSTVCFFLSLLGQLTQQQWHPPIHRIIVFSCLQGFYQNLAYRSGGGGEGPYMQSSVVVVTILAPLPKLVWLVFSSKNYSTLILQHVHTLDLTHNPPPLPTLPLIRKTALPSYFFISLQCTHI